MSQNSARKPSEINQADIDTSPGDSMLEDAFNERTIIRPNPFLTPQATAPEPPKAESKPEIRPEIKPEPRPPAAPSRIQKLDDAFDERTTVLPQNKPQNKQKARTLPNVEIPEVPKVTPLAIQSEPIVTAPSAPAASAKERLEEPAGIAFELNFQPAPATADGTPAYMTPRSETESTPEDEWELRSEKTQTSWPLMGKLAALPRSRVIAVVIVVVALTAFFFLRGEKTPTAVEAVAEKPAPPKVSAPAQPKASTTETSESVLQLFDMAYSRTQGQAHADAANP